MRYKLDADGYIETVFWGCYSNGCSEYTGTVPEGYANLNEWSENAMINAYYIDDDGNLVLDEDKLADTIARATQDKIDNQPIVYKDLYGTNNVLAEQYQSETVSGLVVEATNVKNISPKVLITGIECYNYNKIDIVMQGKQMLNNEAKTETISGVSFKRNYDGSILINGTATEDIEYNICGGNEKTNSTFALKKNTDYYLDLDGLECSLRYYDGTTHQVYEGASGVINVPENKEVSQVLLKIPAGTSYENNAIYPMLNLGAEPYEYEEYQRRMITFDLSEYIEPEVLHPADDLLPADDLYPLGTGIEYIYIEDGIAIISVNGEEKFLGKGNVNLFSDYDLVYTMQDTKIEMTYSTNALRLEGVETKNKGFRIDEEGSVYATSGVIGGFSLGVDRFTSKIAPPKDFTMEDVNKVQAYITGEGTLTAEEIKMYDLNEDGKIGLSDLVLIQTAILSNVSASKPGTLEINSTNPAKTILLKDGDGKEVVNLSLFGLTVPKIMLSSPNSSLYGMIAGQQISTNSSSSVAIPFTEQHRTGDGLTFNGTRIEIGAGVNRVEASFLLHGQVSSSSVTSIEYGIRKNGTVVYKSAMDHTLAAYTTTYLAMPTCEIAVEEGDYLDVIVYSSKTFIVNSNYAGLSFVRVKQID